MGDKFNVLGGWLPSLTFTFGISTLMKVLKRVVAAIGIAMGVGSLLCAGSWWRFVSVGPFPSGSIHTEHGDIPFVWRGEMTWKEYAFVATLAIFGIALIVASYRFGFRRRAEGAAPNGGPATRAGNSGAKEGPPLVS